MTRLFLTRRSLRSAPAGLVALLHFVWATGLPLPVLAPPAPTPVPGCCSGKSCGCAAGIKGRSCCCVAKREVAALKPAPKPKSCCESKPKPAPAELPSWATVSLRAAHGCGHGDSPVPPPSERPAMLAGVVVPAGAWQTPVGFGRCADEVADGAKSVPPTRPPRQFLASRP